MKKIKESKIKNAMRFYLLATQLKYKIRSGWDEKHWNVSKERLESVAEHVYGTCILAITLDSEFECNVDLNKVIKMLVIHELGEVVIGDITPFDNISQEEKLKTEHEAIKKVVGELVKKDELISLLSEFDERKTKEAVFAYHCDKLEADLQSKIYQDMGCHNSLDNQDNNVVFKSSKVQKMVTNGAKTAFDIWYEWDKNIYTEDEKFAKMLEFAKECDTQQLIRNKSLKELLGKEIIRIGPTNAGDWSYTDQPVLFKGFSSDNGMIIQHIKEYNYVGEMLTELSPSFSDDQWILKEDAFKAENNELNKLIGKKIKRIRPVPLISNRVSLIGDSYNETKEDHSYMCEYGQTPLILVSASKHHIIAKEYDVMGNERIIILDPRYSKPEDWVEAT